MALSVNYYFSGKNLVKYSRIGPMVGEVLLKLNSFNLTRKVLSFKQWKYGIKIYPGFI